MAKKTTGKEIVNWEEKFAGMAKDATTKMEVTTAKFISIRGGKLTYGGADVPNNELRCVVLAYTLENQYYVGRFDPNTPQVPSCYAFGLDKDEMMPHESATDKQNDNCATCPLNEYESDPKGGKGKACKNVIRLALIAESDLEDLDNAEIVYMKVPVTSVKNFLAYAKKQIGEVIKRPFWSVITQIKVEQDDDTAVKVYFTLAEKIEDSDLFTPLKDMYDTNTESVGFPYPEASERTTKPAKGKAKAPVKGKFARR